VYVGGICMTTVVASLATAPFALYHFQQLPLYGVVANFLAAPVLSFIVMPAIIVAYLLMPLGLDAPVLRLVGFGNDLILKIAHAVAIIPHATWMPAAWPVAALVLMVAAGIWLLLSYGRWMALAVAPMIAAVIVIQVTPKADMFVADDGKLAAVADADGLLLSDRVHDKTDAVEWARINGSDPKANVRWDQKGGPAKCDEYACRLTVRGRNISYIKKMQAMAEECAWADIVIGPMPARDCRAAHRIGYYELQAQGAQALYLGPGAVRIETVQKLRGRRPWTLSR
jgi:competence protein ComEC